MEQVPNGQDLRNNEESRLNVVLQTLKEWSDLHEKINLDYRSVIANYQKERREMIKYLGTIAGGAAALAPQFLDHIHQPYFFYLGISLLCLVVILSATYILSTIENDTTKLFDDLIKKNELIYSARKPKIDFLKNSNYSVEAFSAAMTEGKDVLPHEDEKPVIKNNWYQPMDYSSEFIVLFMVVGLSFLTLSTTEYIISWKRIFFAIVTVFVLINIISNFPGGFFSLLGFPIDITKSIFRFFKIKSKVIFKSIK